MATLTGKLVSETYKALLKMIDNDILSETEKQISDGFGQGTGIFIDDNGFIRASVFKVTGGGSNQFLKADGSLDSNTYLTDAGVLTTTLSGFFPTDGTVTSADTVLSAFNKIWYNIENGGGGGGGGGYVPYVGALQNLNLGTFGLISDFNQFNLAPTSIPTTAGTMSWNNTDGTADLILKGGNVTLQIGQENVVRVVNKTGADLTEAAYKVVRVRNQDEGGAQGQRLAVVLAQADSKINHTGILGIVTENITNNQQGFVTSFGEVRKIDTTGDLQGETWVDGDVLWLSESVAGELTNIEPETHPVQIGYVLYAHANNGKIFVELNEGVDELDELHDVTITDVQDEDVLFYDATEEYWINKNIYSAINATDVGKSLLAILNAEETIPETTKPRGIRINVDNSVDALEVGTQGYLPFYDDTDFYIDSPVFTDGDQVFIGGDDTYLSVNSKLTVVGGNLTVDDNWGIHLGLYQILFRYDVTGELRIGTGVLTDFITFFAGSVEKGRLTPSGFLGLGLTNPESMIHAKAPSAYPKIIIDNNSASGGGLFSARQNGVETALFGVSGAWNSDGTSDAAIVATRSEQGIRFYTNGTNTVKMGINFEGNVFVGALPSFVAGATQLIVSGFSGAGYLGVNHYDMSIKGSINTFNSLFQVGTSTFHSLAFIVQDIERARINSSGRMLLGTQTDNTVDRLQVNGSLIATAIKKTGGTSLQFLKADGSVDNNVYYLDSNPYSFISLTELSSVATGLTYTNFTGVFSLTDGYVIPTTTETADWDTAYTNRITFAYAPLLIENNDISISKANTTTDGYLSSTDWNTFNNKSNTSGTVTSVAASVPTGFAISGSPITTSGTLAITFASGYSLPTTVKQSNWDDSYTFVTAFPTQTGNAGKYLTTDGSSLSWGTVTAGVSSFNTRTGAVTLTSTDVTTALGYTPVTQARTLSINGTTYDLSADRAWTISAGSSARNVSTFTATAGQTVFTIAGGYTPNLVDVFLNGARLTGVDFTATNGTTIVLAVGVRINDIIDVVNYLNAATLGITGSGTSGYLPKFTGTSIVSNSLIFDNGTNVGIGLNSPASKLDVLQEIRVSFANAHQYRLRIFNSDGNGRIFADGDAASLIFGTAPSGTGATAIERLRITPIGNVGVGTSLPSANLHIQSSSSGGQNLRIQTSVAAGRNYIQFANGSGDMGYLGYGGGDGKFYIVNQLNDAMIFINNSVESMRITSSGSLQIGSTTGAGSKMFIYDSRSNSSSIDEAALYIRQDGTNLIQGWAGSGGGEKMRLSSNGFLKASPNANFLAGDQHELNTNVSNRNIMYNINSASSPYGNYISFQAAAPNNLVNYYLYFDDTSNLKFIVYSNGSVYNRTGTYAAISDARLKENIVDANPKLEELLKIKIRNYNLIGDNLKQIGVVAQELEHIFPTLIDETYDKHTGKTNKGVKYSIFIPIIIKATQELYYKFETQAEKIARLETRVQQLEAK